MTRSPAGPLALLFAGAAWRRSCSGRPGPARPSTKPRAYGWWANGPSTIGSTPSLASRSSASSSATPPIRTWARGDALAGQGALRRADYEPALAAFRQARRLTPPTRRARGGAILGGGDALPHGTFRRRPRRLRRAARHQRRVDVRARRASTASRGRSSSSSTASPPSTRFASCSGVPRSRPRRARHLLSRPHARGRQAV